MSLPTQVTNTSSLMQMVTVGVGSGGAVTALVVALQKFFERYKDKNVSFGPNGQVESMTGFSARDVTRVLDAANRIQREQDELRHLQRDDRRIDSGQAADDDSS
ncbi:hypothetical protein [Amycolatopsis keratiniphila]|uniref:hypothetical protein n=1 Tax=Amycolatopsis keratiniphila TaxID=129921 RepID=UPI000907C961|nr:hypothetical protein [Amycolatopsis keratiniphila]OLZ51570.1 hypothetical protein BS330_27245 [Amycolatopsis keratiniphila subsp. nogabecina]